MEYGAIDLHKKESQVRIITETNVMIDRRIATTRDQLTGLFGGRSRARILIEASTESEWVARHLETLGHEVIVADPNFGLMYGHRSRRVKTDRRDVAALAEACRHGIYRATHRRSPRQRAVAARVDDSAGARGGAHAGDLRRTRHHARGRLSDPRWVDRKRFNGDSRPWICRASYATGSPRSAM